MQNMGYFRNFFRIIAKFRIPIYVPKNIFGNCCFGILKKNRNSDRNSEAFPVPIGISEKKISESKSEGATENCDITS